MTAIDLGIVDEYGTVWSATPGASERVGEIHWGEDESGVVQIERAHLIAMLDADWPHHVLELRADGRWSLEHPIGCRALGLLNCETHRIAQRAFDELDRRSFVSPPAPRPGRYLARLFDGCRLELREVLS